MQYESTLVAGQTATQHTAGTYFAILDMGASAGLDVQFWAGNTLLEEVRGITQRLKARSSVPFERITLKSANAATVKYVISNGALDIDGANVNATIVGTPTVDTVRGTPGNLMYVSGVSITDAPATSITAPATVAMGAAAAVIIAANANRRGLRFANLGANDVAIGPATIAWATRCIVLAPGDVWVEERAANLAWSGICNAGLASTIGVQEVIA